jgi:hypothetical protein
MARDRAPLSHLNNLKYRDVGGFRDLRRAFGTAVEQKGNIEGGSINVPNIAFGVRKSHGCSMLLKTSYQIYNKIANIFLV